jgi:hypothetical protein
VRRRRRGGCSIIVVSFFVLIFGFVENGAREGGVNRAWGVGEGRQMGR